MALQNVKADVDGPNTGYTYDGSTNIAVVMGTDDVTDETDRIRAASGAGLTPAHDWFVDGIIGAQSIDQVDTTFYVRESGGESEQGYADDGVTLAVIFTSAAEGGVGAYVDRSDTDIAHPTNPNWAPTDFPGGGSGIIFGVRSSTNLAGSVFATYFNAPVIFTPISGQQAYLVSCWIPPLLTLASHALMKSEIAQILHNHRIRPTYEEEFAKILEGFRVRPRFAF